jgi:hypothetical protein
MSRTRALDVSSQAVSPLLIWEMGASFESANATEHKDISDNTQSARRHIRDFTKHPPWSYHEMDPDASLLAGTGIDTRHRETMALEYHKTRIDVK